MNDTLGEEARDCMVVWACRTGNLPELKQLLESGADMDIVQRVRVDPPYEWLEVDYQPIHHAVKNGQTEIALYLINAGCDIAPQNDLGIGVLHLAAKKGNVPVLKALLEKGCDINALDGEDPDKTPLHFAIEAGADASVHFLLKAGADTTKGYFASKHTPFHIAVCAPVPKADYIRTIVEAGWDINATDSKGFTALYTACQSDVPFPNWNIVESLIDNGADIDYADQFGYTSFMMACIYENLDLLKLLVHKGCNYRAKSICGHEASHLACASGQLDIVKYLHSLGCLFDTVTQYEGQYQEELQNYIEYIDYSLLCGQSRVYKGKTPVMLACLNGHLEVVKFLHSLGCDMTLKDDKKESCLHHACALGRDDISIDDSKRAVIKYLLEQGADVNKPNARGLSPAHMYMMEGINHLYQDGIDNFLVMLFDKGAGLDERHENVPLLPVHNEKGCAAVKLIVKNNYFCGLSVKTQQKVHQYLFFQAIGSRYRKPDNEATKLFAINVVGLGLSALVHSLVDIDKEENTGPSLVPQWYLNFGLWEYEFDNFKFVVTKNKDIVTWVEELEKHPFALKHLCRLAIRKHFRTPLRLKLSQTGLPGCMVDYVMYNG